MVFLWLRRNKFASYIYDELCSWAGHLLRVGHDRWATVGRWNWGATTDGSQWVSGSLQYLVEFLWPRKARLPCLPCWYWRPARHCLSTWSLLSPIDMLVSLESSNHAMLPFHVTTNICGILWACIFHNHPLHYLVKCVGTNYISIVTVSVT